MNVVVSVIVPRDPAAAFCMFVDELQLWWPPEYTWSGDVLQQMTIEPRVDGRCYEIGPHAFRCDWGRVLAFEPPHGLLFSWQISPSRAPEPNPDRSSEVKLTFDTVDAGATRVTVEHRRLERHGSGSEDYRAAMASDMGWPYIMQRFAEHCSA